MRGQTRHSGLTGAIGALAALCLGFTLATPISAQTEDRRERSERQEHSLSSRVGQRILELMEAEAEGLWTIARDGYRDLLASDGLSAYEQATVLKLLGRARYELDDTAGAITAWQQAVDLDALPDEDANVLRINSGQLLLGEGEYRPGVDLIEAALTRGTPLNADLALRLAQGYGQLQDYRTGMRYARQAFEMSEAPDRQHYSILLFFYQQLDLVPQQTELMAQMIARWPDQKSYWTSYASLLARSGREQDAFEINRILYLNGMLDTSAELIRLAQYYSYYEYPYGGATMLERELNAGRVDPTPENYQALANLWRQAREWDRALPVLRRVATLTGAGPDYEKLGEALYQSGDYAEAEAMFVQALNRGGLSRPGDTWNLVGTVRVDTDDLEGAVDAFEAALAWEYSRAGAQGWISFVEQKIAIERQGEEFRQRVAIEGCELDIERMRRSPPLGPEDVDSEGRRIFPRMDDVCQTYFNLYGELHPEFERS
ncbi:tetratricopeptide repeat protein [Maricaulis parjimensis]|uniref:tetratricopeptide repeat protein n=1 Tax=Maricaulis parjimensis TaxID=144023 RepID=UPI00193A1D62|nr:tetratricopeptide repeat protein [Maricaulis parjimensis]